LSGLNIDETTSFEIANKIYEPSYISLESALRYYNFIPEQTFATTSISTCKTKKFKTPTDIYNYRNISEKLFFGYEIVHHKTVTFKMASREKAILDYFYFHKHFKTEKDIAELRFNIEEIKATINKEKLQSYLPKYSKTFSKIINNFLNYIYHD